MRRVYAIVKLTLAEAIRTRLAVVFILLLVALMVLLVATSQGDGTVRGQVQMFMSYAIGCTHFLLALLVVFLACRTVDQDIKTQRIDSLVVKPVARWQFLLGRWLGIVLLACALLVVSMGVTYVMIGFFARRAADRSKDRFELTNQVLVARRSVKPPLPDVSEQVEKRMAVLKQQGALPEGTTPAEARKTLADAFIRRARTVRPRHSRTWRLTGLGQPSKGDAALTLRFKYAPSTTTEGSESKQLHSNTVLGQWIIGRQTSKRVYVWQDEKPYRTALEIPIPVDVVTPDGSLDVTFRNVDPRGVSVNFPLEDGIEVLYRVGTFTPNFLRTVLIAFVTIVFVATLGLACSTFLSFPIASLVTITVFFVGMAGHFLTEAIGLWDELSTGGNIAAIFAELTSAEGFWSRVNNVIAYIALQLIPVLDVGAYTDRLIAGRVIEWSEVVREVIKLLVVWSGLLWVFAALVFKRREVGRVIV